MQLRELKNKWGSNITDYDPTATLLNKFQKELAKLPKKESLILRSIAKFQGVSYSQKFHSKRSFLNSVNHRTCQFTGLAIPGRPGSHGTPPPFFFALQKENKEIKEKQMSLKAETIKSLLPRSKCY